MNEIKTGEQILKENNLQVGNTLIVDHIEWKIADTREEKIILYREDIDGTSLVDEIDETRLLLLLKDQPL